MTASANCSAPSKGRRHGLTQGVVDFARRRLDAHRVLRFLVIGGVNTAFGYGMFVAALAIMPTTFTALVVSTVLGVLFNFRTIGRYVFRAREPGNLVRFFGVYGVVFAYNAVGLAALARTGLPPWLLGLMLLPGAVALSYILNREFVFRGPA